MKRGGGGGSVDQETWSVRSLGLSEIVETQKVCFPDFLRTGHKEQDTETNHVPCQDLWARDVINWSLLAYFLGNTPVIDLGIVHLSLLGGRYVQGYLAHKKTPNPLGPPEDPRQRPTVGS